MKRPKVKAYLDTSVYNRPFDDQSQILTGSTLREAGWKALVKSIGMVNATRFILQYESGYGDYTKIKRDFLKAGASVIFARK